MNLGGLETLNSNTNGNNILDLLVYKLREEIENMENLLQKYNEHINNVRTKFKEIEGISETKK